MRNFYFLIFVVLAFCCWGLYGPVLHVGQIMMGGGQGQKSYLYPLICVGFAYFLIAVVFPTVVLFTKGEKGHWSIGGFTWSFIAGGVGAVGALGIILAFKFQGKPFFVMPLVFGLAPIINTLVTMLMGRTFKQASPLFYVGIVIVALGAAGVLINKPSKQTGDVHSRRNQPALNQVSLNSISPISPSPNQATNDASPTNDSDMSAIGTDADEQAPSDAQAQTSKQPAIAAAEEPIPDPPRPIAIGLSIALTALCWGAYGPVLHKGQAKMGGSRLRPFLCVGLAYFVIAVIGPILLLEYVSDPGSFSNLSGAMWSLGAGATGAIGALGIIYAFNFGGKPLFVMPLVFGFAPVVNTFYAITSNNLYGQVPTAFFISLAMVIFGAVTVLVTAPKGKGKPKPATATS